MCLDLNWAITIIWAILLVFFIATQTLDTSSLVQYLAAFAFYVILWLVATLKEVDEGCTSWAEAFVTKATDLETDYLEYNLETGKGVEEDVWDVEVDLMKEVVQEAQKNLNRLYLWSPTKTSFHIL